MWGAVLVTGCVLAAAPARAAAPIGLSPDGTHWGEQLAEPLFDPAFRWVPGDSETATFYVRNQAAGGADLRVDVRDEHGDPNLGRAMSFAARVPGGQWVDLQRHGASQLLDTAALGRGESLRVDLRATFDRAANDPTQDESVAVRIGVTLSAAQAGPGPRPPGQQNIGVLASTGSAVQQWMLWLAAILVGIGLALVVGGRRREVNRHG